MTFEDWVDSYEVYIVGGHYGHAKQAWNAALDEAIQLMEKLEIEECREFPETIKSLEKLKS